MVNISQKEPHVVVVAHFVIDSKDLFKKEIRIETENLNKDGLLERMEKERERIYENIEIQLADGEQVSVRLTSIDIKESFLNPDLKAGETIISRFISFDGFKIPIN